MKIGFKAAAASVASVAIVSMAGPAHAHNIYPPSWGDIVEYTWDYDVPAGRVDASSTFRVRVADIRSDGYRAVSWISVEQADGSWNRRAELEDADGHNDSYTFHDYNVARGKHVRLTICKQNGSTGTPFHCEWSTYRF